MVQDDADKICNGLPRPRRETDRVGEGEPEQMERLTDCFWYRVTMADWHTDKCCNYQIIGFLAFYPLTKQS